MTYYSISLKQSPMFFSSFHSLPMFIMSKNFVIVSAPNQTGCTLFNQYPHSLL